MRFRTTFATSGALTVLAFAAPGAFAHDNGAGGTAYGGGSTAPSVPDPSAPPAGEPQPAGSDPTTSGGQPYGVPNPLLNTTVPGTQAKLLPDGFAAAPAQAPTAIQQIVFAANQIVGKPYIYGGGHQAFKASGYDCSGTVSYALHGASLLSSPLDSSSFMRWGQRGPGAWITIYANGGHAYMVVAGLRLDTSSAGDPSRLSGPRWRPHLRKSRGFKIRHPIGY